MTDYKTILNMIEAVDPADTAKLDEIDARVGFFVDQPLLKDLRLAYGAFQDALGHAIHFSLANEYTQSRDALKAIWPKPYDIQKGGYQGAFYFGVWPNGDGEYRGYWGIQGAVEKAAAWLPTEELAELHAIIQAIAYERGQ